MEEYVVYASAQVPSESGLPDIIRYYVSQDSDLWWHFDFTKDINAAERFDKSEAKEVATILGMSVKKSS